MGGFRDGSNDTGPCQDAGSGFWPDFSERRRLGRVRPLAPEAEFVGFFAGEELGLAVDAIAEDRNQRALARKPTRVRELFELVERQAVDEDGECSRQSLRPSRCQMEPVRAGAFAETG